MNKTYAQLGDAVQEIVTSFKGVIVGEVNYLTGCRQCLVQPRKLDEKGTPQESRWYDEIRLTVTQLRAVKIETANEEDDHIGGPATDTPPPSY